MVAVVDAISGVMPIVEVDSIVEVIGEEVVVPGGVGWLGVVLVGVGTVVLSHSAMIIYLVNSTSS